MIFKPAKIGESMDEEVFTQADSNNKKSPAHFLMWAGKSLRFYKPNSIV